jgi:putrescine aminotransferase
MQDAVKQEALGHSRKALDLMARSTLTADEQKGVVDDCVTNFDRYVNPGILEYRKSCSTDYTAVEWRDEGNVFFDIHGKEFIDCLGGYGIYVLGHRHPTVVKAVTDQLQHQALHSQELLDPMRGYASELLGMLTPGDLRYSFFCNSGTEANEGALKLAKLHGKRKKANHTNGIISCLGGFHGKSLGSLSVTGKAAWREPFYPFPPHVRFVPYGDADALDKELKVCDTIGLDISAFIAEPVQGEAGANVPPDDFFPKVREICDKWGILFIADEVQTGMGRTGTLWGIEHWGVAPDIMTLAKGLGSGMPIGMTVARRSIMEKWKRGAHGNTYGGNPLCCAAASATLDLVAGGYCANAATVGAYFADRLRELQSRHPLIGEVRGKGLMIGMELVADPVTREPARALCDAVVTRAYHHGLLLLSCGQSTVRFMPPLTVSKGEIDEAIVLLERALVEALGQ